MDFKEKYEEFRIAVENKIEESIPAKAPKSLYDAFRYIMTGGGKRIRPVLTMICAGLNGENPYCAINAAVAIEILHNFTLVHDDIMDNSSIRRGRETVHIKWNEDVAILSGDMMVGWAFRVLQNTNFQQNEKSNYSENHLGKLNEILSTALIDVCEGQEYDMNFNTRSDVTEKEYLEMVKLKTSSLLCCAAKMGAIVGNCTEKQFNAINIFAENLGIAFQIQDDVLDFSAEQIKFGKKIGQDIIEGKKSFPILKAAQIAENEDDTKLINLYMQSKNGLDESYVENFKEMFERLNIFEICQNEINEYFEIAEKSLAVCEKNEYFEMLNWLIKSLNKRVF